VKLLSEHRRSEASSAQTTALEIESSASAGDAPARGLLVRLSRSILFFVIFVVYTGAFLFLITFSSALLYGTYLVIGACAIGILFFERAASKNLLSTVPYLVWLLVFYCYWGTLVAWGDLPEDEVVKTFVKNLIILSAFALAVIDRRDLRRVANWFQIGALLNLAVGIRELWDPKLILTLARIRDPEANAYDVLRPAGLWCNPDEAAFAFIFAFLISFWARGPLAWIGRLACLIGIYMTGSRTGVYVLILCGAVYLALRLRSNGFNFRRLPVLFLTLAATTIAVLVLTESSTLRSLDISNQRQVRRIFDFNENTDRGANDPTRLEIAQEAIERIWERPWTGHGIFSFQDLHTIPVKPSVLAIGAHNVFITVWGETGIPGIITYLLVLALGIRRLFNPRIAEREQRILVLMWISYLVIGFTWHDQFIAFSGMLYVALLYHLPSVTRHYPEVTSEVSEIYGEHVEC
jgi:O-antigen ligase